MNNESGAMIGMTSQSLRPGGEATLQVTVQGKFHIEYVDLYLVKTSSTRRKLLANRAILHLHLQDLERRLFDAAKAKGKSKISVRPTLQAQIEETRMGIAKVSRKMLDTSDENLSGDGILMVESMFVGSESLLSGPASIPAKSLMSHRANYPAVVEAGITVQVSVKWEFDVGEYFTDEYQVFGTLIGNYEKTKSRHMEGTFREDNISVSAG